MNKMLIRGQRADNGEWVQSCCILRVGYAGETEFYLADMKDEMEVYFGGVTGNILSIPDCNFYRVDPKTVGRSTGLHDRNGKLLFEGDIVKIKDRAIAYISWYEYDGLFILSNEYTRFMNDFTIIDDDECEWIGNIHENAELLGSDEE